MKTLDAATLAENLSRVQEHLVYETGLVRVLLNHLVKYGDHRPTCPRARGGGGFRVRCTCGWLDAYVDIAAELVRRGVPEGDGA